MTKLLQDRDEFDQFRLLLQREGVSSYLEIGCWSGGSILAVASVLPRGARIVAVDKPFKQSKELYLRQVMNNLSKDGYDTRVFIGDSTDPKIVAAARKLGPYDAVFIDADHTLPYIKSDWENYGRMGRIVGFHDIARDMPKDKHGGPHEVASFWKDFKGGFRHAEFISERSKAAVKPAAAYGIGVVWNV